MKTIKISWNNSLDNLVKKRTLPFLFCLITSRYVISKPFLSNCSVATVILGQLSEWSNGIYLLLASVKLKPLSESRGLPMTEK